MTDPKNRTSKISFFIIIFLTVVSLINIAFLFSSPRLAEKKINGTEPPVLSGYIPPKEFKLTFLDVGQGDCVIIQSPGGFVMINDAGIEGRKYGVRHFHKEVGAAKRIMEYLEEEGINKIDLLVLSHAHLDHYGGFIGLLNESDVKVEMYMDPGQDAPSYGYKTLLELIKEKNIKYKTPKVGEVLQNTKDVGIQVLEVDSETEHRNRSSVVMYVKYNDLRIMLTGDAEAPNERRIIERYGRRAEVDILKVGHHGSRTSSSRDFLKFTNPKIALIGVGENNQYKLPRDQALNDLKNVGAEIYRTDIHGTITIKSVSGSMDDLKIITEK